MGKSRTKNAIFNTAVGIIAQICTLVITIFERKVFVNYLSLDYLGINGLYSNILSLLALSELGISSVIAFYLYKPVFENDVERISSLLAFFRRVYYIISAIMLIIGMMIIPVLDRIVDSDLDKKSLILFYVIFLLDSVVTIPIAPRIALLNADQNQRVQRIVTISVKIVLSIVHILILRITHNYTYYVIATLISTIITQLLLAKIVDNRYPYIKKVKCRKELSDKKEIIEKVKSVFLCKIGSTIINSTDNILISVIVTTAAVGLYSNYATITGAVMAFVSILTGAMSSGVGNLSAEKNKNKMYNLFRVMLLAYQAIGVFCFLCMMFVSDEFIGWWLGDDFILDKFTLFVISFRMWESCVGVPLWTYRDANGQFEKVKYVMLIDALLNIVFSVILGHKFGMAGILLATIIADLFTTYFIDPFVVYKYVFGKEYFEYWRNKIKLLILSLLSVALCFIVLPRIPSGIKFLIPKVGIIFIFEVIVFGLGTYKTDEIRDVFGLIADFIKRRKK